MQITINTLDSYEAYALEQMKKWDLISQGWKFIYNNRKRALGVCSYRKKTIELSKEFAIHNDVAEVHDTILHEIAHALAGSRAGHGRLWKQWAVKLGARPQAGTAGHKIVMEYKYEARCSKCDNKVAGYHRRPTRDFSRLSHRNCGGRLVLIDLSQIEEAVKAVKAKRKVKTASFTPVKKEETKLKEVSNTLKTLNYPIGKKVYDISQLSNKSFLVSLEGKKVQAKAIFRQIMDIEGLKYTQDQHQRTLGNKIFKSLKVS